MKFCILLKCFLASLVLLCSGETFSAERNKAKLVDDGYNLIKDVSYVDDYETDEYKLERCKLDIYYPAGVKNFATLVWFHGGGLEAGNKDLPDELRNCGFAVVSVNYRLFPKGKCPDYIEDAAQAVAWTFEHISEYGGTPDQIYVSGNSAG